MIVEDECRGKGLGTWLMETALADPRVRDVGRWILATRDAHDLYQRFGFTPIARPERWMERIRG